MLQTVDAIVVEYNLGLLDGAAVAAEMKQVRPKVPIVMVADDLELPDGVLKSVDALVTKSDGPHFLWAAVHFVLNSNLVRLAGGVDSRVNVQTRLRSHLGKTRTRRSAAGSKAPAPVKDEQDTAFTPELWASILNGTLHF